MKDRPTPLTQGPIAKTLAAFALPLFLGNLFQQMYNIADSLVVGNFIGSDALAAVASSGHMVFLLIGFLQGVFVGAGVIIANHCGARDAVRLRAAVHTTVLFALLAGGLLSALGVFFSPAILRLMGTPPSVLPNSLVYFRIYFGGLLSAVLYNCANGILQATGDSRRPLYYLIFSSLANVVLDLIFVVFCRWGVAGVAAATVISQAGSAALAFYHLSRYGGEARVSWRALRPDWTALKQILRMGVPAGMQNSIISFANMVVQSHINSFGAMAVAGSGVFLKLEGFAFLPISSFALSVTTFIGQNAGAGEYERARRGARVALFAGALLAELLSLVSRLLAPRLIGAFNSEPDVVRFGVMQAQIAAPFYFLPALSHCMAGILRGAGRAAAPMLVMLACWCVLRVGYLEVVLRMVHDIRFLYAAYPITWTLSTAVLFFCCRRIKWDASLLKN